MNLSMSVIGFFHTLACILALAAGAYLMVARKGTPRHRRWGDIYTAAILFASFSSLTIYTRHHFTAAHWFAVMAIVAVLIGFAFGRWHGAGSTWRYGHIAGMLVSYYVLIGGGVNEVFLRVSALRPYIVPKMTAAVGLTHMTVMLSLLLLIVGFWIATAVSQVRLALQRRKARVGRVMQAEAA
jgi:uncharacterized membrane protein